MNRIYVLALLLFGFACRAAAQTTPPANCPPVARVADTTDTYGKTVVPDPYQWLEDQNSPETRAWIDAEQACTTAALSKIPGRDAMAKRFAELFHVDEISLPRERGGRYFFRKRLADQELAKLLRHVQSKDGPDEVLVDPLPWSADHTASAILENVSADGKFLYYARRDGGKDEVAVHVMDVDARRKNCRTFCRPRIISAWSPRPTIAPFTTPRPRRTARAPTFTCSAPTRKKTNSFLASRLAKIKSSSSNFPTTASISLT